MKRSQVQGDRMLYLLPVAESKSKVRTMAALFAVGNVFWHSVRLVRVTCAWSLVFIYYCKCTNAVML